MFERFTDRARMVLTLAQEEARGLRHSFIGTEHILLGLVHEGEGVGGKTLAALDVTLTAVRREVELIMGGSHAVSTGSLPFTPRAKKVLELSLREALQLGHSYIGTEHLLLGLVEEGEGVAMQVLGNLGVDPARVRQLVVQRITGGTVDLGTSEEPGAALRVRPPWRAAPERFGVAVVPPERWEATVQQCALCGRDLWEVAHYVAAGEVRVCGECIVAAANLLVTAGPEPRELTPPPRVYGETPDAASVGEIVGVVGAVFGAGRDPEGRVGAVQDGAALEPQLRALGDRLTGIARVSRIRFVAPDLAELRFHFRLVGRRAGEVTVVGRAERTEGAWALTRSAAVDALERAGIRVPADG